MSPLPQRKKSAEEIAKLRESLGVPGAVGEETPAAPAAEVSQPATAVAEAPAERASLPPAQETPPPAAREPKPVRSLRKAERAAAPVPHRDSPPDSSLPHQRHSAREIEELRRREMHSLMNSVPNPRLLPAHPALIIPGYLCSIAAAVGVWVYQMPPAATLVAVLAALAIAGFIWRRKPVSRHHAAFIAVFALFLLVFSALHYFPHLRHAT
jgi:hypothetical protein